MLSLVCVKTGQVVQKTVGEAEVLIAVNVCGRYILSNIEHFSGVRRGDRIWQLGFGGGFKCNSAVWRARRSFKDGHECWE